MASGFVVADFHPVVSAESSESCTGQVIGSTNRLAEYAKDRPVSFQEIFATLYHNLGIDTNRATVTDLTGRPQYLVESNVQPIRELI